MTPGAPDLPPWAALIVTVLVLTGSGMTLIGSIGLMRLRSFYNRIHAPTMGSSAGVACISIASIVCGSVLESRLAIQESLIFIFVTVTTPVTFMLLARAALFRDQAEGNDPFPPGFDERSPDSAWKHVEGASPSLEEAENDSVIPRL